ncbi:sulfite exporter TauE/SafE family protein [uncultured Tolumonas sp.]|uniref:sulfite exporter TauE/SafE family protein n=1 Tax=uncultured Tolumonas sp. TaxID=263765 RepID=UPI002A0A5602|nr:sulfite exporter TauE/SafE family protein [uncultured Tolumonas sp.]
MLIFLSIIVILFAGFTQGLTSFGFALISMPLLSKLVPLQEAVPLVVIMSCIINIMLLIQTWRHVQLTRVWLLISASLVAAPLGTYLLLYVDSDYLKLAAGILISSFALLLIGNKSFPIKHERLAYFPVGFLSGLLNGSISMSGPPVVLFLSNQGVSKEVFRANGTAMGVILNSFTIAGFYTTGLINHDVKAHLSWLVPGLIIGGFIGAKSIHHINEPVFKKLSLYLILISGVLTACLAMKSLA